MEGVESSARGPMARAFRYRASFKPSEVVGLFILSLLGTMSFCVLVIYLSMMVGRLLG
jgi:hypothetical protein